VVSGKYVHHALVNDGVTSCLTDDEVCPLNNDNRHEERRVTRVLECLALSVRLSTTTTTHTHTHTHGHSIHTLCTVNLHEPARQKNLNISLNPHICYVHPTVFGFGLRLPRRLASSITMINNRTFQDK